MGECKAIGLAASRLARKSVAVAGSRKRVNRGKLATVARNFGARRKVAGGSAATAMGAGCFERTPR